MKQSKLQREVSSLRTRNSELDGEMAELRQKYSRLSRTHNSLVESAEGELDLLRSRVVEVEGERDRLKGWERRAGALAIELEEERRRALEGRSDRDEEASDQKVDRVMKDELHRECWFAIPDELIVQDKPPTYRTWNERAVH
jgi:chromosome segregation ATPase